MIKKILISLAIAVSSVAVNAQMAVGDWTIYTGYGGDVTQLIETPTMVFFVSDGSLFHYSKTDDETFAYTARNSLSSSEVKEIRYNRIKDYLMVIYADSNIDLILDDGKRIVNLPDIKNATSVSVKNINDVSFSDGRIFVATGFGLVVFDDTRFEVYQSGIYNINIETVEVIGDYVVISWPYRLYFAPLTASFVTFDSFKLMRATVYRQITALNDHQAALRASNELVVATFDFKKNNLTTETTGVNTGGYSISPTADGAIFYTRGLMVPFSSDASFAVLNLPDELKGNALGMNTNQLWAANGDGVGHLTYSDGQFGQISERFVPMQATPIQKPLSMNVGHSGAIYMNAIGNSNVFGIPSYVKTPVCRMEGDKIVNVTPKDLTINNPNCTQPIFSETLVDAFEAIESPTDPNTYYIPTWWEGIYKITDGKESGKYDFTNSPMTMISNWACCVRRVRFDKSGNLWAINYVDAGNPALMMLPASKLGKSSTTVDDWKKAKVGEYNGGKEGLLHLCSQSGLILLANCEYEQGLYCYNTNNTPENFGDDRYIYWSSFTDQDSKSFAPTYLHCITEDKRGKIWVGTSSGVIELASQSSLFEENMRVNRIKVPRNDGTNYADYLLDGESALCIAIDSSDRKWIGTASAGVYLVSEDGSQILQHFTTENSYLPSNKIGAILCDPKSNSVFFGTEFGLVEYSGTSSPASPDYSDVVAYPNPVTPDYTGLITIKGLMENSLVKISDSAGNVFYTTRSEGGMATWNGCNAEGQRVKSGVYFVLSSQNANGSSSGVVTKILIVN